MSEICVFTATRAEYGLLYWLMKDIQRGQSRIFLRCRMMATLPLKP